MATMEVDKDGYVTEESLQRRYREFYKQRQEKYDQKRYKEALRGRNLPPVNLARKDYCNDSPNVIPLKSTPSQVAQWWYDPSSCDIQYIDAAGPPRRNVPSDLTPSQKKAQGHIGVIATPQEEYRVRRQLARTYSEEDMKKLGKSSPTIQVMPERKGVAGSYRPVMNKVTLDRQQGMDQGTVSHEVAHLLRHQDKTRRGYLITAKTSRGIEESCTVAEQMARSDEVDYTGYYWSVAVYDEHSHAWRKPTSTEARRMAEEDHALFTYGRHKGLKGDAALKSVQENWTKSHIARLNIDGMMAINRASEETGGQIQKVSMAKDRRPEKTEITNATAGKPGVAAYAAKRKR